MTKNEIVALMMRQGYELEGSSLRTEPNGVPQVMTFYRYRAPYDDTQSDVRAEVTTVGKVHSVEIIWEWYTSKVTSGPIGIEHSNFNMYERNVLKIRRAVEAMFRPVNAEAA